MRVLKQGVMRMVKGGYRNGRRLVVCCEDEMKIHTQSQWEGNRSTC